MKRHRWQPVGKKKEGVKRPKKIPAVVPAAPSPPPPSKETLGGGDIRKNATSFASEFATEYAKAKEVARWSWWWPLLMITSPFSWRFSKKIGLLRVWIAVVYLFIVAAGVRTCLDWSRGEPNSILKIFAGMIWADSSRTLFIQIAQFTFVFTFVTFLFSVMLAIIWTIFRLVWRLFKLCCRCGCACCTDVAMID